MHKNSRSTKAYSFNMVYRRFLRHCTWNNEQIHWAEAEEQLSRCYIKHRNVCSNERSWIDERSTSNVLQIALASLFGHLLPQAARSLSLFHYVFRIRKSISILISLVVPMYLQTTWLWSGVCVHVGWCEKFACKLHTLCENISCNFARYTLLELFFLEFSFLFLFFFSMLLFHKWSTLPNFLISTIRWSRTTADTCTNQ